MSLKSIHAKLAAIFLFILALSLAIYIALFSITMNREAERTLSRSLPIIEGLLKAELSCPAFTATNPTPEHRKKVRKVLARLQETLSARHVWILHADSSKVLPEGINTLPGHKVDHASFFTGGITKAYLSAPHQNEAAIVFPVSLWGKEAKFIFVQSNPWPYHRAVLDFFIPTAATGLLIGLIVFPLMRCLLRPLKKLEQQVIDFATGDLKQRATPLHDDEVGRLSRAFNILADNIEQMTRVRHELTANISHELRSPLTRIQMAEELARMGCKQQDIKKKLLILNVFMS